MILGIDHLSLSTNNWDRSIKFFKNNGYSEQIFERNLDNLRIKSSYLHDYSYKHNLTLLHKENYINVELIQYETPLKWGSDILIPILCDISQSKEIKRFLLNSNRPSYPPSSTNELDWNFISILNSSIDSNLIGIIGAQITVLSLKKSILFWSKLGFVLNLENENNAVLECSFPLNNIYIVLKRAYSLHVPYLDEIGFSSIAFICSNIVKERQKMESIMASISEIDTLFVSGRELSIFFCRGEDGILFEFIQFT